MMKSFRRPGISLDYPSDWSLQTEAADSSGWTITLNSPETSFLMISLMTDVDDQHHVSEESLRSLKADYPNLDCTPYTGSIANHFSIGYDVDFVTLDQISTAQIRVLDTIHGILLLLLQSTDYDRDKTLPIMSMIIDSVRIED